MYAILFTSACTFLQLVQGTNDYEKRYLHDQRLHGALMSSFQGADSKVPLMKTPPVRTVPLNFIPPSTLDMPLMSRRRDRSRSPGAKEDRYQGAAGKPIVDRYQGAAGKPIVDRYRERSPLRTETAAYTDSDRHYQLPQTPQVYQAPPTYQTPQPQAQQAYQVPQTYQAPQPQAYQVPQPQAYQAPQPQAYQAFDIKVATTGHCGLCDLANRSASRPETEGCYTPHLHRCSRLATCRFIAICCYYHTREEMEIARGRKRYYKSVPCHHYHNKGSCELGARCGFVHDVSEMHCYFCKAVGKHLPVNCPLNPRQVRAPGLPF